MRTLYHAAGACSLAPHIALEWIGAPYEAVRVQFGSRVLLAVNPAGAVPTLREDDGWLLTQVEAILDYPASTHPEAGLAGGEEAQNRNSRSSLRTAPLRRLRNVRGAQQCSSSTHEIEAAQDRKGA